MFEFGSAGAALAFGPRRDEHFKIGPATASMEAAGIEPASRHCLVKSVYDHSSLFIVAPETPMNKILHCQPCC